MIAEPVVRRRPLLIDDESRLVSGLEAEASQIIHLLVRQLHLLILRRLVLHRQLLLLVADPLFVVVEVGGRAAHLEGWLF